MALCGNIDCIWIFVFLSQGSNPPPLPKHLNQIMYIFHEPTLPQFQTSHVAQQWVHFQKINF